MSPFYIVLATVAMRLVLGYGKANEHPYIVSIYNKHTGSGKGYNLCAGSLVTSSYVLTTRFCLPRHAYKIRYGDMKTVEYPTYSQILHRKYHPNSRPEVIPNQHLNFKQVVSGSNNIAMALVQPIPAQKFGRLTAIDYSTIIGHEVTFCMFDVSTHTSSLRTYSKKIKLNEINLKTIFKRKKKLLRQYFLMMSQNQTKARPRGSKHQLVHRHDIAHVVDNVLRFATGVVTPCQDRMGMGPNMCVVERCYNANAESNRKLILTPDFGTPLIYDGKIVGITADVDEYYLKFTPISPFLNWINNYVVVDSPNVTKHSYKKRKFGRLY